MFVTFLGTPDQLLLKSTVGKKSLTLEGRQCCKTFTIDNPSARGIIYMQAEVR